MRYEWIKNLIQETGRDDDDFRREVDKKLRMDLFPELQKQSSSEIIVYEKEIDILQTTELPVFSSPTKGIQTTAISECIDSFIENRGDIKENTEKSHRSRLNLLIEDFGDIPIGSITREMETTLKYHIVNLPRTRKLNSLYRKYDFHELVQMNVRDDISTRTVKEHLTYLSSLLEYCKDHGYTDQNPFTGMKLHMKIRPRDERDRFSELEIKKLFKKENYIPSTQIHKKRYEYYWIPLLSLFTGMRLGEICPLYIDNVRKIKKRWCIDIVQEEQRPDKSIKTLSSRRIIQIHNTLIDLGSIDFLQILKKKDPKRERIFEELRYIGGDYNKNVSKFWNVRYLLKLGLKTSKKNFHSLRHTVSDHLKQKVVEPNFVKELLGHSSGKGEWDSCGKNYEPEIMFNKCIKRIVYKTSKNNSVDFRRLKVDWKIIMN
jgi:integrase